MSADKIATLTADKSRLEAERDQARSEAAALRMELEKIAHGLVTGNDGPSIELPPAQFHPAMWDWMQKVAKNALASPSPSASAIQGVMEAVKREVEMWGSDLSLELLEAWDAYTTLRERLAAPAAGRGLGAATVRERGRCVAHGSGGQIGMGEMMDLWDMAAIAFGVGVCGFIIEVLLRGPRG